MVTPDQMYPMPSQQEGQLDDALITKLLTNWPAQSRSTADAGDQSPASATVHHTGGRRWHGRGQGSESPKLHRSTPWGLSIQTSDVSVVLVPFDDTRRSFAGIVTR